MYTYDYPMFSVVVDIIVQRGDRKILLIKRKEEPFKNCLALPGGYVNIREEIVDAAKRELEEETGIVVNRDELDFVGIFSHPERDPRGRVISHAYCVRSEKMFSDAVAGDDAKEIGWYTMIEAIKSRLAFDHLEILDSF